MPDELELFLTDVQELDAYAFAEHIGRVAHAIASISDLETKLNAVMRSNGLLNGSHTGGTKTPRRLSANNFASLRWR